MVVHRLGEFLVADYYTQFSAVIGPFSAKAATWLTDELTRATADEDDTLGCEWEIQTQGPLNNPQVPTATLWVHSFEWGNLNLLDDILTKYLEKFAPNESITIEWGNSCSKPRPDGFGGGAMVITATKTYSMNTSNWIDKTLKGLKKGAKK